MEQYNVKCPICGTVNKNLYLKETDGWFVCEHCQNEQRAAEYTKPPLILIPRYQRLDECVNHE